MSKRVIDDNGAQRSLIEVPMPLNQNTRSSFDQQQQQPPFNNSNNYNNNQFGNNNNNQQNDFSLVPRVGTKKKTIVIKDEKGNEISRITSSMGSSGFPDNLLPRSNSFILPPNQYQVAPFNSYPVVQPQYMVPNTLPPPPSAMVTSVPMYMTQPFSANPFIDRGPLITQTIPLDQMTQSARSKRSSAHYTTLEK